MLRLLSGDQLYSATGAAIMTEIYSTVLRMHTKPVQLLQEQVLPHVVLQSVHSGQAHAWGSVCVVQ
jgi:hypothetical protein